MTNNYCEGDSCVLIKDKQYEDYFDDNFIKETFELILEKYQNKETFFVLYTAKACPWCEELMPVLNDVVNRLGKKIDYVTCWKFENGKIVEDYRNNANEAYKKNLEMISDYIGDRLGIPCLVYVKEGKAIRVHDGTVESHDAHERKMTSEEKEELVKLLEDFLNE